MQLTLGNRVFSPSLWPTLVFLALLPLLLSLGVWQASRAQEKQVLLDAKQERRQAAPMVLNQAQTLDPVLDRFRPAKALGHYVPGQQWLLDNRLYHGQAGYHVFSLFQMHNGRQILINRGWVNIGASREFLPELPLPQGEVSLQGNLDAPASVGLVLGEPPVQSLADRVVLQNLNIQDLAQAKDLDLLPLSLVINEGQPGNLQYDWSAIETISPEKHLGYSVQWFALATALLIIYVGVNTQRKTVEGET
jgi:surfeit locus 1 family protein